MYKEKHEIYMTTERMALTAELEQKTVSIFSAQTYDLPKTKVVIVVIMLNNIVNFKNFVKFLFIF